MRAVDIARGAARCRASSRCGPARTSPICRRSISATRPRGAAALPPAAAGAGPAALCRRAGRGGVRRATPISPKTRPTSSAIEAEELPPVLDAAAPPAALRPASRPKRGHAESGYGDLDAAFACGPCRRRARPRRSAGTAACRSRRAARWRATTPRATCSSSTARPRCRTATATSWRACSAAAPPASVLKEGNTGGGFGIRGELYPEDFLVCLAAMRLGRPVKWIEDRREHLMAANHSREQRHHVRAAVDAEGRVLALEDDFFLDQGAYIRTHGARVPEMTIAMVPGPYRVPAYRAGRPFPPDQQDAGRDLSRARPLRGHVRARAPDGCGRRPARPRPHRRCAGAT